MMIRVLVYLAQVNNLADNPIYRQDVEVIDELSFPYDKVLSVFYLLYPLAHEIIFETFKR